MYLPPGTVSAQINDAGSTSAGGVGQSVAGTTGMESVMAPACERAWALAPAVEAVEVIVELVMMTPSGNVSMNVSSQEAITRGR